MDESLEATEVAASGECALLALLRGVLDPDPERGASGDFAVFSQDGMLAAIALPFHDGPGEAPVIQVNDFFLPWAVGSMTIGDQTFGFTWRYAELCLALDTPELRVELGVPATEESIPLFLPAFRVDAPFATRECQVLNIDVSSDTFRACGYARRGERLRPLVWSRPDGATGTVIARDIGDLLSPDVGARFIGTLGFLQDGRLEVCGEGIDQPDQLTL